ncbi:YcnI family protein [Humibacter ginsenosidimutans]|uniref:YcnI family protein n=2 Tax=Humibacter ginsenosidimutans TaxID=2599293 RepID=A0A5B8M7X9_9MICO|nr:YcnI family protein [Humibacter ginsenosidimutans]
MSRVGIGAVLGVAGVLVVAGVASAHVKVSGVDTTQGGYGVLTFRVPSESATASTTELTVTFPSDTPITSASTQPMPGWTATVKTAKLAKPQKTDDGTIDTYVSQVDWKADNAAAAIPPGQFQMFNLSVGPLPKEPSVSFPSLQYYNDGSTVNWNEKSTGGAEPEHPAPVLQLAAATDATSGSTSTPTVTAQASGSTMDMNSSNDTAWTGIVGLIAGILGLIAGAIALVRSGRKPAAEK